MSSSALDRGMFLEDVGFTHHQQDSHSRLRLRVWT